MVTEPREAAGGIARGAASVPANKPVACAFMSSERPPAEINEGSRGPIPCYTFPENIAIALDAANRYARWRSRPAGSTMTLGTAAENAIRTVVDRLLATASGPIWVLARELFAMLEAASIDAAESVQAGLEEAPDVAQRIGFPLVAKIVSPDVVHKSDIGGVIMGLRSADDVAQAAARFKRRMEELGKRYSL
jgi:acetate---CoA ligase (ADP-forming)